MPIGIIKIITVEPNTEFKIDPEETIINSSIDGNGNITLTILRYIRED